MNATAAPIVVEASFFINWEPPWMTGLVDGREPRSGGENFTVPANGSLPVRLELTPAVSQVFETNTGGIRAGVVFIDPNDRRADLSAVGEIEFVAGNDQFVGAKTLDRVRRSDGGVTTGATKETGEPAHAGNAGGASLWFRYETPRGITGRVSFNTQGSDFDTLLAVYTGTRVDDLTMVASNDNAPGLITSALSFDVVAGQTYYIALDGAARNGAPAETGFYQLLFTEAFTLTNDAFTSAAQLTGASGQVTQALGFGLQATRETGEPPHGGGFGDSVWYRWTAPTGGVYRFAAGAPGPGSFPNLAVYLGDTVTNLTEVVSNSIFADATYDVIFTAVAGAEYRIALAGSTGSDIPLVWGPLEDPPPLGLFAAVLPSSRAVQVGQFAAVFATMANTSAVDGRNCRPEAPNELSFTTPVGFDYQTTNPQNEFIGTPNTPVDIPAGGSQNWVLNLTRGPEIRDGRIGIRFVCDNLAPAPIFPAANTWTLRVLENEPADVIAIGATLTTPGVAEPPLGGSTVFTVAGINIGVDAPIRVRPRAERPGALTMSVCETDAQGACFASASAEVTVPAFDFGDVRFFTVFVTSNGQPVAFDPGLTRLSLEFFQGATLVGATSVAARTVESGG